MIGRFPGETSCLSLCWAVLDLVLVGAQTLALTDLECQHIAKLRQARLEPAAAHTLTA